MKAKLRIDTTTDIRTFVAICSDIDVPVMIKDGAGHCVSGKSILGMLYSLEWSEIWCECEKDIYSDIQSFVIV